MNRVAVLSDESNPTRTAALAHRLGVPELPAPKDEVEFLLVYHQDILHLQCLIGQPQSICVDFASAGLLWRQRQALLGEMVVKAAGGKKALGATVLDATAGLGQDGFILAAAGFNVHMNESSPVVHALLEDGLQRLAQCTEPSLYSVAGRLALSLGDSRDLLHARDFDIVYLDPMFPERRKSAKVKKNMQVLQQLLGHGDADKLLALATRNARKRVVVKRPRLSGWLEEQKPSLSITGKSSRFDIYLRAGARQTGAA